MRPSPRRCRHARRSGFSPHVGALYHSRERRSLERRCRHIDRPAESNGRIPVNDRTQVVHRLVHPVHAGCGQAPRTDEIAPQMRTLQIDGVFSRFWTNRRTDRGREHRGRERYAASRTCAAPPPRAMMRGQVTSRQAADASLESIRSGGPRKWKHTRRTGRGPSCYRHDAPRLRTSSGNFAPASSVRGAASLVLRSRIAREVPFRGFLRLQPTAGTAGGEWWQRSSARRFHRSGSGCLMRSRCASRTGCRSGSGAPSRATRTCGAASGWTTRPTRRTTGPAPPPGPRT